MNQKYACIHGHFYQPPRENAWLEEVEQQESASPFHDWNERINYECYAPNTAARILDSNAKIIKIRNNYSRISFNMGPTLLSWLEKHDPESYTEILEADRKSSIRFDGHGSAMAQAYSHAILPLCNERDRETQVIWGLRDFEYRFGHKPEGMWLAETAANTESLEAMAAAGIKFTVLAPRQMKSLRKIGATDWTNIHYEAFDTTIPYRCNLPSGRSIALFFYHGGVSQGVAFEGLLNSGKAFGKRILSILDNSDRPQLAHIATDGESYGHHHRHGEMALADCLRYIEEETEVNLINYGAFLEKFPPEFEANIHENSSWSCVHGIERWRSNCGCNTGGSNSGHQLWRGPLRDALDWLREEILPMFEREASSLLRDPWAARNDYISVILDRSATNVERFMLRHATRQLTSDEQIKVLRMMEMQRNAILMYTSCGWFFNEVSGIETNQILQYACRAIDYAKQVGNLTLEAGFMDMLRKAPSNIATIGNAANNYQTSVQPSRVSLQNVGMHYAVMSLFEEYPEGQTFFNYTANNESFTRLNAGQQILVMGRTTVRSNITHSEKQFSFAVLYLGQLNIIGSISTDIATSTFEDISLSLKKAFENADLAQVLTILHEHFEPKQFSVWHLFKDQKQDLINRLLDASMKSLDDGFRAAFENSYQLMLTVKLSNLKIPEAFLDAAQHVIAKDLMRYFEHNDTNTNTLLRLLEEKERWAVQLPNEKVLRISIGKYLRRRVAALASLTAAPQHLKIIIETIELLEKHQIKYDHLKVQDAYFDLMKDYEKHRRDIPSEAWMSHFVRLGDLLKVQTKHLNLAISPA